MPIKYIIALNFETTMYSSLYPIHELWFPEIINFAAVLLNLQSGRIESTFHTEVQPTYFPHLANPLLPKVQVQPIGRLPTLQMVLYDFDEWLTTMCEQRNVQLPSSKRIHAYTDYALLCTWSNIDLGYYLFIECKRKNIRLRRELTYWLDAQKVSRRTIANVPEQLNAAAKSLGTPYSRLPANALDNSNTLAFFVHKLKSCQAYLMDLEEC